MLKQVTDTGHDDPREERRAIRFASPRWRDPRLAVGLMLIGAAVAGTAWVVQSASVRESVYVATRPIAPGEQLTDAGLAVAEVNLGGHVERYLLAGEPLPAGSLATRSVNPGELVPRSAVGQASQLDVRPVAVPVAGPLPAGLRVGGLVDLWRLGDPETGLTLPPSAGPQPRQPTLLASALTVREIGEATAGLGPSGASRTVQVLVPSAQLALVLGAVSDEGRVVLVPVPSGASQ